MIVHGPTYHALRWFKLVHVDVSFPPDVPSRASRGVAAASSRRAASPKSEEGLMVDLDKDWTILRDQQGKKLASTWQCLDDWGRVKPSRIVEEL